MGSGIGTILASIGIPMLLDAIMGKGLQVDSNKTRSRRSLPVHVPKKLLPANIPKKDGGLVIPQNYRSDLFFGTWDQMNNPMLGHGMPKKRQKNAKKKGEGLLTGGLGIPQDTAINRNIWSKIPLLGQII